MIDWIKRLFRRKPKAIEWVPPVRANPFFVQKPQDRTPTPLDWPPLSEEPKTYASAASVADHGGSAVTQQPPKPEKPTEAYELEYRSVLCRGGITMQVPCGIRSVDAAPSLTPATYYAPDVAAYLATAHTAPPADQHGND